MVGYACADVFALMCWPARADVLMVWSARADMLAAWLWALVLMCWRVVVVCSR